MKSRLTTCALLAALVGLIAGQSSAQPPFGPPPGVGPTAADLQCDEPCVELGELEPNSVDSERIVDATVGTSDIAAGAVTEEKLAPGLLDPVFVRTVVVGPVGDGSDTAANGAALLAALNSITDNSPGNRYLLRAEPGTYDLGAAALNTKPFVDVEGSGVTTTLLRGEGATFAGVVTLRRESELRHLTVEATGVLDGDLAIGIEGQAGLPGGSARITDVVAKATNGSFLTVAIRLVGPQSGTETFPYILTHVRATAVDDDAPTITAGIALSGSGRVLVEMVDVTAVASSLGFDVSGLRMEQVFSNPLRSATARNSVFRGDDAVRFLTGLFGATNVFANFVSTQLDGGFSSTGNPSSFTIKCVGAYDGNLDALDEQCLPIP